MRMTAEIRWFWPGRPPHPFEAWFRAAGPGWGRASDSKTRTDAYLRDHRQIVLGIKKRGGANGVEIKGLISRRPTVLELAGCACAIGLWGKWPSLLALDERDLIKIAKQRWMRKFEVEAHGVRELAAEDGHARLSGCDVELTLLQGPDAAPWWTLGFEAFGVFDRVEADLVATVAAVAHRAPPSSPGGEASGYPGWLAARQW
jgi:hypothetical protein